MILRLISQNKKEGSYADLSFQDDFGRLHSRIKSITPYNGLFIKPKRLNHRVTKRKMQCKWSIFFSSQVKLLLPANYRDIFIT